MIVADTTFDLSDSSSLDAQIEVLKSSGAEILLLDVAPAIAARALRKTAELDWRPVYLLDNASASIANALRPAGLQNASGVISTSFLKDANDPAWKDDPAMKAWSSFMDKYYPEGANDDSNAVFAYAAAATLFQVPRGSAKDVNAHRKICRSINIKIENTADTSRAESQQPTMRRAHCKPKSAKERPNGGCPDGGVCRIFNASPAKSCAGHDVC